MLNNEKEMITVAFISNYLNHHQLPICLALDKLTGGKFTFVATTPVPQARLNLGYHDMNKQYPFVLTTYDSAENAQLAQALAVKSDVVIIGSAPDGYITQRLKQRKLTFRYCERFYKQGLTLKRFPRAAASAWLHHGRFMRKPIHMLCASAYTAADCAVFGNYVGRTYKWGYFPQVKQQNVDALLARKRRNSRPVLLWAGRMLDWKHPEAAIHVAERLKKDGVDFELRIIGNGEMEKQLQTWIRQKNLEDCVQMLGSMSPEAVRDHMESADIFLFTSDFNEGWGAVLNESMNSACAVVASHAIGSAPFLLEDGQNGFIYKNGDENSLYDRVAQLLKQPELRETLGRNAYQTLAEKWNADVAAQRFMALSQALLDGKSDDLFVNGPCSKAKILKNGWYK